MQQATSRELYAYWDRVRNGRLAPRRFEIEPGRIAQLLPETFIAECQGPLAYRFRLAGTRICEYFGRELRGGDLLGFWGLEDRHAFASLLRHVVRDAAVGQILFTAHTKDDREARFELVIMPLIHTGGEISRLLGAITAIEPPFWLGAQPLTLFKITDTHVISPEEQPQDQALPPQRHDIAGAGLRERFRVYRGGIE